LKQPAGATPNQAWQRCSFFIEAVQPQKSTEGAKRCARWQQWPVVCVVLRSLCSCAADRLNSIFFNNTAVADKQCGGLQTRVDVGALPARRAILSAAAWTHESAAKRTRGV